MAYNLHHISGRILHNLRTMSMPVGMLAGALLYRPIAALEAASHQLITPTLIFLTLFVTFCRVRIKEMHLGKFHLLILSFQLLVSIAVYLLLLPLHPTLAQGGMICILTPVAMAAVVIGGMLGANITTMATYSLLCNLVIAFLAPVYFSFMGSGTCTLGEMLSRVMPLLIGPFLAAQLFRFVLPKAAAWVASHGELSFYTWLTSLVIAIGRTTSYILGLGSEHLSLEIALAFTALLICLGQFKLGRLIGSRYGDVAAGGQSLGQKNTILAIWMAQSFLDPISSIAPTAYIVWQNLVNSYQIYRHDKRSR